MRSWPSKVSLARMRMNLGRSGSSAASSLFIGRHRGDSKDASWQTPSLTTPARLIVVFDLLDAPLGGADVSEPSQAATSSASHHNRDTSARQPRGERTRLLARVIAAGVQVLIATGAGPGTFRAHHIASCPEPLRIAEISAAGQTTCTVRSPWSDRRLHKTRPTGLVARCLTDIPEGSFMGWIMTLVAAAEPPTWWPRLR